MSKRLVFLVEGDCEINFINNHVIPYLYASPKSHGWTFNAQKITTNRKMNAKGGNVAYSYLKNEINRLIPQEVWITTLLDFFRIPNDFPGYSTDCRQIDQMQKALSEDINYPRLIPYIQQYEFEALLFSDIRGFEFILDDKNLIDKIKSIENEYPNPEDINGGASTAPSKRLESIFSYCKTKDSELILSEMSLETIIDKCPRFNQWIKNLVEIL